MQKRRREKKNKSYTNTRLNMRHLYLSQPINQKSN